MNQITKLYPIENYIPLSVTLYKKNITQENRTEYDVFSTICTSYTVPLT